MLRGAPPEWKLVGTHALVGLVAFLLAVAYTRSVEDRMIDVI